MLKTQKIISRHIRDDVALGLGGFKDKANASLKKMLTLLPFCNPTCSLFASESIRSVAVITLNLIGHYLAGPLF